MSGLEHGLQLARGAFRPHARLRGVLGLVFPGWRGRLTSRGRAQGGAGSFGGTLACW